MKTFNNLLAIIETETGRQVGTASLTENTKSITEAATDPKATLAGQTGYKTSDGVDINLGAILKDKDKGFFFVVKTIESGPILEPYNNFNSPKIDVCGMPLETAAPFDFDLIGYNYMNHGDLLALAQIKDAEDVDENGCPACSCGGKTVKTEIGFVCAETYDEYGGDLKKLSSISSKVPDGIDAAVAELLELFTIKN